MLKSTHSFRLTIAFITVVLCLLLLKNHNYFDDSPYFSFEPNQELERAQSQRHATHEDVIQKPQQQRPPVHDDDNGDNTPPAVSAEREAIKVAGNKTLGFEKIVFLN